MAVDYNRQTKNEQAGMDRNVVDSKLAKSWFDNQMKLLILQQKINKESDDAKKKAMQEEKAMREEQRKKDADSLKESTKAAAAAWAVGAASELKKYLDSTMDNFVKTQEAMAYNLNGTGKELKDITNELNTALSGNGITRQEDVYKNLYNLVQKGIVNNAEQRAYLQTLSNDLGMMFDVTNGSLTRLIRLQNADLTSNRMAIQASLKEFLNQNYKTSEYIQHFTEVSANLLEAQSLMSGASGMALESTIQKWMGSLSSVGMSDSTIGALSQALGYLGSGNISALSSNASMQNLLVMGAARSGLSYGDLLHSGLSAEAANTLLNGIVTYIAEMGGNSSNVVKSEYARIFGLSVSDISAAGNLSDAMLKGINESVIGDDITQLLLNTDKFVYATTKISNILDNMKYSWATGIASRPGEYAIYKASDLASQIAGSILQGQSFDFKLFGSGISIDAGKALQALPLVTALAFGITNGFSGGGFADALTNIMTTVGGGAGLQAYTTLSNWQGREFIKGISGNLVGFENESGVTNSGSMVVAETDSNSLLQSVKTSAKNNGNKLLSPDELQAKSLDDVYNLLSDAVAAIVDLPNQPFGTVARIAEAGNTVTIGNDLTYIQDLMTLSAMNIQNIYSLLVARFSGQSNANVVDTSTMQWNHPFDWMSTAIGGNA